MLLCNCVNDLDGLLDHCLHCPHGLESGQKIMVCACVQGPIFYKGVYHM